MAIVNETTGDKIKRLREGLDMTQEEAAEVAGISQPTWCRYEADRVVRINREHIERIALVLNTTPEELLDYHNEYSHMPDYIKSFLQNPNSLPYLKKAYIEYIEKEG
jgi:transcriptional regulator with XRE-family HTH domain